ncbi:hypothetical protein MRX96_057742 [Rhipicephalus microplus]
MVLRSAGRGPATKRVPNEPQKRKKRELAEDSRKGASSHSVSNVFEEHWKEKPHDTASVYRTTRRVVRHPPWKGAGEKCLH